jgi:molybdenum cofactor cytidylyltransferase
MSYSAQGVGVVILAAGRSGRMAQPKLLLPWGDTSVLGHQIRVWQRLRAGQIAVVCAAGDAAMQVELDRLGFPSADRIFNPQPDRGMFSSIRCAADWPGWLPALTHCAISLGDQPHVKPETLRTLLELSAARPGNVCQPRRQGRLRHPVILPKEIFLKLRSTEAGTLKDFLSTMAGEIAGCDSDDAGLDFDIDTPADYERAMAESACRSGRPTPPKVSPGT